MLQGSEMVGQIPTENVDVLDHPALQVSFSCYVVSSFHFSI